MFVLHTRLSRTRQCNVQCPGVYVGTLSGPGSHQNGGHDTHAFQLPQLLYQPVFAQSSFQPTHMAARVNPGFHEATPTNYYGNSSAFSCQPQQHRYWSRVADYSQQGHRYCPHRHGMSQNTFLGAPTKRNNDLPRIYCMLLADWPRAATHS